MKKRFRPVNEQQGLREKLIGLGESSLRKSYYPELQLQLDNLNERVKLAELMADIGRGLTEERELRSSLQRCSDALIQHAEAAFVRIWTLDSEGEHLTLQASSGLHTATDGSHSRLNLKTYPHKVGIIARNRQPLLTNEVQGNPQFHNQQWIDEHGIVAFAGYPLMLQQQLVGVIALFAQHPLGEAVLEALESINDQIAVSIDRFQLLEAYQGALANAREHHAEVSGILRSVADALLVIDSEQRIKHMNQAAESLLGTTLALAFDRGIDQISSQPALLEYLGKIEQLSSPQDDIDLDIYDAARNEMRIIQARAARLKGGHSRAEMVISLRDVTQDREVARLKSEFISTAAHELRTPLTSICGFTELLCNKQWPEEEQSEYLHTILDKAESLERIIDELLDLSRIESGRGLSLNYSEWDISSTLLKIIARYRAEHRDFRFETDVVPGLGSIHADHGKILQTLDNLLSNAIKYSAPGSLIQLAAKLGEGTLALSVTDQGIGMTAEQCANCFEKFYRVDSSNTAVGGLGLGLSIVRHVVESHHGQVAVVSTPNQGTTFTLSLPLECQGESCPGSDSEFFNNLYPPPPGSN